MDTEIIPDFLKESFKRFVESKQVIEPDNIADGVVYVLSTPPHVQVIKPLKYPYTPHTHLLDYLVVKSLVYFRFMKLFYRYYYGGYKNP